MLVGSDGDLVLQALTLCGAPSPTNILVFNGDFVDRGHNGIEVLASLALLKLADPRSVLLLRGNHEDEQEMQGVEEGPVACKQMAWETRSRLNCTATNDVKIRTVNTATLL